MEKRNEINESKHKTKHNYSTKSGYQPQNQLVSKQSTMKIRHSDNSIQQDLSPYPEMITPINKQKTFSIKERSSQSKLDEAVSSNLKPQSHIDYPYETDSNYNTQNPLIKDSSLGNWRDERNSERWEHVKSKSATRSQRPLDRSNFMEQQRHHSSSNIMDNNSQRQRHSMTPSPRTLSQAHNTAAALTRSTAIYKFQNAVQRAIQNRRQQLENNNPQYERSPSGNQDLTKKHKPSLFDVVMKLNPFGFRRRKETRVVPNLEQIQQINTHRGLLEPDQEEVNRQLIEQRRARARQLWRKAKSVLRAIMTWKAIQSEIQLYGTHNYEFRRNFKMTRSGNIMKGQTLNKESSEKEKNSWHYSIHPESKFKKLWSVILIFLLMYVATIMPFNIAFVSLDESPLWFVIDTIVDFAFLVDVLINFFSAYHDDEGILVTQNRKIAKKYLKSWFLIDLVASFPMNLIQRSVIQNATRRGNYNQILRLLRLPRLYRLLKIARLVKLISFAKRNPFIQKLQDFMAINAGVMKLLQFLATGIMCIHLAACMWFLASQLSDDYPNTWIVRNELIDSSMGRQYLASLYWSITTILTVGYGDIVPGTNTERAVCIIWMVIGVGFYSFTIGTLTSILSRIDTRSSQLKDKVEVIEIFCSEAKINQQLQKKIKDVLEYNSIRNAFSWIEKYSIFNELPPNLKCEVAMQIHDGAIGKLPFFQGKDQTFIGNIVPLLQPLRVSEYDYIYMQDDHPYELYFIVKGRVNFVIDIGECVFKQWPQGSYFGEIEIIKQKKRICTAKAASDCDLFTLNKKYYQTIIQNDYPEVAKKLKDIAQEREIRIEEGFKKSMHVLDAVGIHDGILPLSKLSRMGSVQSATSSKYFNAFSKTSARQAASNLRKFSASQRSMFSKPSQENLILASQDQNQDSHSEESDESSENYNIWGDKEKEYSSEDEKKDKEDSFHTDKSMKDKNPFGSEKGEEKSGNKHQLKKRASFSVIPLPTRSPYEHHSKLDLVKESSFESGSLRKSNKRQYEDQDNVEADDIEEFKVENEQDSSIPKIQIIHEPSILHQNSDNILKELQKRKSMYQMNDGINHLEIISPNFQDSHFFSNQNDSPPQYMFKNKGDESFTSQREMNMLDNEKSQSTLFYRNVHQNIEAPKIKINDKTYNYSQMDISSNRNPQNELSSYFLHPKPLPLTELQIVSSIGQIEIQPTKMTPTLPQMKFPINKVNEEVVCLKDAVKDIQKEMQSNKFQQSTIQDKIGQITQSLDLISKVIRDITQKQSEQQKQINDQEQRIRQQESQKFQMASNFRPKSLIYQLQARQQDQRQNLNNQSSFPQSFSLNSNNSLIPVARGRINTDQLNSSIELLRIPQQKENGSVYQREATRRDFSYGEDLENLQREYGENQEISRYSLPDQ